MSSELFIFHPRDSYQKHVLTCGGSDWTTSMEAYLLISLWNPFKIYLLVITFIISMLK